MTYDPQNKCGCDCHAMSKDRIKLFIDEYKYDGQGTKYRQLIEDVFDLKPRAFQENKKFIQKINRCGVYIICRPSQYGRFIALRNHLGFTNDVKGLRAVLFVPKPATPASIDVSKRTNRVWNSITTNSYEVDGDV